MQPFWDKRVDEERAGAANSISRGGTALEGQNSASELRLAGPVAREACRLGFDDRFAVEVRDDLPFHPALRGL